MYAGGSGGGGVGRRREAIPGVMSTGHVSERSAPSGRARKSLERARAVLRSPADILTGLRLVMTPFLWVIAALHLTTLLGAGVAVAASTDVADGYIARRTGRSTEFGSRFDSIADHLLTTSTAIWLVWLRPDFFREQMVPLVLWACLAAGSLLIGWVRFRRIGDVHLYSAKAAGTLGYIFAVWLLMFGSYPQQLFAVVIAVCYFAAVETSVALLGPEVNSRMRSLLFGFPRS